MDADILVVGNVDDRRASPPRVAASSSSSRENVKERFSQANIPLLSPYKVPKQRNGCDCGVFVLKYAEKFALDVASFDAVMGAVSCIEAKAGRVILSNGKTIVSYSVERQGEGDEFSIAVDPVTTMRIEEVLKELRSEMTIILVSSLVQQARRLADRTAFFHQGRCVEVGETEALFNGEVQDPLTTDYLEGRFG